MALTFGTVVRVTQMRKESRRFESVSEDLNLDFTHCIDEKKILTNVSRPKHTNYFRSQAVKFRKVFLGKITVKVKDVFDRQKLIFESHSRLPINQI